ncbi:hypothetical protein ABH945_003918 [Paraburkholderia sp. GAS333]|uniref:hypothetical protein n=1 Tax=Paraburkholderia sp. GAS333 TaxID=3156279 RepID=UPI003D1FE064
MESLHDESDSFLSSSIQHERRGGSQIFATGKRRPPDFTVQKKNDLQRPILNGLPFLPRLRSVARHPVQNGNRQ